MIYDCDCWLCRPGISTCWWTWWQHRSHQFPKLVEEIAADTPALRFCAVVEDMWLFTTSLKGVRVLALSLSSDSLNVSGRFAEAWHQEARDSGGWVWVNVDNHISDPSVILVCGHQTLETEAFRTTVLPDFCLPSCSSLCLRRAFDV